MRYWIGFIPSGEPCELGPRSLNRPDFLNPHSVRMSPRLSLQTVKSIGLLLCSVVFAVGCSNKAQEDISRITARQTIVKERRDSVREAFRYLPQLIRLDRTTALKEIRYQLMSWSSSVKPSENWKSPAVLESVSPSLRTTDFSKRMKSLDFGESECEYLLQCQMFVFVFGFLCAHHWLSLSML